MCSRSTGDHDVLHANYWVSGAVGHRLKHELDLPAGHDVPHARPGEGRSRAGRRDPAATARRSRGRALRRSRGRVDARGARPARAPLRRRSRRASRSSRPVSTTPCSHPATAPRPAGTSGSPAARSLLFVGRIQPLKGADLAVRALAERRTTASAQLVVVGGPSGPDGEDEVATLHALVAELGLEHRVHFVAPQPHDQLVDYYRAADVCVVPSRTESFGLVALEAAACGTPVVAANVGGLRLLVDDGVDRLPRRRARSRAPTPRDRPCAARRLRASSARMRYARSTRYRWSIAAARLRRHYDDLAAHAPRSSATRSQLARSNRRTSSSPPTSKARSRRSRTSRSSSTTRSCGAGTCASRATGATRPTIYFDLHERTLRYEVYFLPTAAGAPPRALRVPAQAQPLDVRRPVLARARRRHLPGRSGRARAPHVEELDRIIGVLYELTERWFQPVVKLAYGRRTASRRDVCVTTHE